jgi:hypothetical protein
LLIFVFEGNPLSSLMARLSWCGAADKTLGNLKESVTVEAGMQESGQLDELDFALIDALQIAPRASWKLNADVLGLNPVTDARRWERLNSGSMGRHGNGRRSAMCAGLRAVDLALGSSLMVKL